MFSRVIMVASTLAFGLSLTIASPTAAAATPTFDINEMLSLVNAERAKVNVRPLRLNSQLIAAAQTDSDLAATAGSVDRAVGDVVQAAEEVADNAVPGNGANVADNNGTAEQVMQSWINSPGHYKNIINKNYTHFGAGVNNFYWTQVFGSGN